MAASSTSDEESNQWPGYVDALTTMTMMLVFIMVILAVAIFGLSRNAARGYIDKIAAAAELKIEGKPGDLEAIVAELRNKIATEHQLAKLDSDVRIEHRNTESQPLTLPSQTVGGAKLLVKSIVPTASTVAPKPVVVSPEDAMMRLVFSARAVTINTDADASIVGFLERDPRTKSAGIFEIKAYAAAEASTTDARRIAFYRLMSVRSKLMDLGIPAARIVSRVHDRLPGSSTEDVHVFVRNPA
jgi:hypothetical protein